MPIESAVPSYAPWITFAGSLAGAFGGAFFGQWLSRSFAKNAGAKKDLALIGALIAEVEHCGHLAAIYVNGKYVSPAYRLHTKIYDSALPTLAASVLTPKDVDDLISFYTHVDQVNSGLDEVHELLKTRPRELEDIPQDDHFWDEFNRLKAKARDTMEPNSKFYKPVLAALKAKQEELRMKSS